MKKTLLTAVCLGAAMFASAQTVIFEEDFEWLAPWTEAGNMKEGDEHNPAGDTIGNNDTDAYCPFITTSKVDDVSTLEALQAKGYDFVRAQSGKDDSEAAESVYLQTNYLKFGKSKHQSGIVLPSMTVEEGATATVSFDWSKQRQGSGIFDETVLVVIVENAGVATQFAVPTYTWEENEALAWHPTSVELTGAVINADTKLTIRPEDAQWSVTGQHRWFVDNIKVTVNGSSSVSEIAVENAPVEYYNILGVRVENPTSGLYIVRQGKSVKKVVL